MFYIDCILFHRSVALNSISEGVLLPSCMVTALKGTTTQLLELRHSLVAHIKKMK